MANKKLISWGTLQNCCSHKTDFYGNYHSRNGRKYHCHLLGRIGNVDNGDCHIARCPIWKRLTKARLVHERATAAIKILKVE